MLFDDFYVQYLAGMVNYFVYIFSNFLKRFQNSHPSDRLIYLDFSPRGLFIFKEKHHKREALRPPTVTTLVGGHSQICGAINFYCYERFFPRLPSFVVLI